MKNPILFQRDKTLPLSLKEELRFIISSGRPFVFRFLMIAMIIGAVWIASCASPILQKQLVDAFNSGDRNGVILYGIGAAAALALWRGGETLWGLMGMLLNVRFSAHLKRLFFRHLLKLPLGVVESGGSGYLGQRLHLDIEVVSSFVCSSMFGMMLNFLKLSGAIIMLTVCAPEMMLASSPVLLIFLLLVWIFRRRQFELSAKINEAAAEYRRNMQNSLDRLTLFKSRSGERRVDRRVGRNLSRLTMLRISRIRWERFYTFSLQLLPAVWCAAVWCYGAAKVLDKSWTLGGLWAVSGYMMLIFSPGKLLFSGILAMRNSDAAMARLVELKRMLPEESSSAVVNSRKAQNGAVEFKDISFTYPDGKKIFEHFNLSIADGEHVGLYGPSGGGKSTLGALLLRLYDVSAGEITLDGKKLSDYSLNSLRQSVGYIGQSTELFYASVRENLSHGGGYQDAKIIRALRQAGLGNRLDENPELLDVQIREDGSNFSAGERLKLALARELLRDTKVLVLDEATASLDKESEQTVFDLLRGEWKKRTVIFISHRSFTAGVMDRTVQIG